MDKTTIGIPRSLYYYYHYDFLKCFFEKLDFKVITSPKTNKEIMDKGISIASDEMCLSLKEFLGHTAYLDGKCDYLLITRIYNYGRYNQMCTNFLSLYDLVNNLYTTNILDINIDYMNKKTMFSNLLEIGKSFGFTKKEIKNAYDYAIVIDKKNKKKKRRNNLNKLKSENKKILIVAHPYVVYDDYFIKDIKDYLTKNNIEIIYSDLFNKEETHSLSETIFKKNYWHYTKTSLGSIKLINNKIDGIIFLSAFPCGLDSIVNEIAIHKIDKPYININIDDINSNTGIETRLESFVDLIENK